VGARALPLRRQKRPRLVSALHATRILHLRRLSVSRMRENFTYGLMRGRWKRAAGLLDRDTRLKRQKQPGVAGPHVAPRHCSTLQKRNVIDALPERMRSSVRCAMSQAYATRDHKRAARMLENLARRLEPDHPGAAPSLREGLEETLTLIRLDLPESLERVLSSTNLIENLFSRVRDLARRVKRLTIEPLLKSNSEVGNPLHDSAFLLNLVDKADKHLIACKPEPVYSFLHTQRSESRRKSTLIVPCVPAEQLRYGGARTGCISCMRKLDRLVWAEGACLESYGVRIGIRASRRSLMDQLAPFLPPRWEAIEPPRRLDALYSWVPGGRWRPNVRAFELMYMGWERIARTLKPEELFRAFEANLRMTIALLSRHFVFIHAGVVGWKGRAVVMPGRTFTGKSTLVEAFVRAGAEYFSDEYAVLDRNGRVHPFAKPVSVRMPVTFEQELRTITEIGGRTAERPMKVGAILVTRYREGAKSHFRNASPGRGVLDLVVNAVAARWAPSRVLRATRNACAGAIVLRGSRGEARETVERLLAILDGRQIGHSQFQGGTHYGFTGSSAVAAQG